MHNRGLSEAGVGYWDHLSAVSAPGYDMTGYTSDSWNARYKITG